MGKPGDWIAKPDASLTAKVSQVDAWAAECAKVEKILDEYGAKYTGPHEVPLARINLSRSRHNQARPQALIPDVVDRYAGDMRRGDRFPPSVGFLDGAQIDIISGNHRDAAARRADKVSLPFYLVDPDSPSELIALLTVVFNADHGQPVPEDWRLHHAEDLIRMKWAVPVACKAAGITQIKLQQYRKVLGADIRAKQLAIRNFAALGKGHKLLLSRLSSDPAFSAGSRVAIDSGMTLEDLKPFVQKILERRTELEQMEFILQVGEDRKLQRKRLEAMGKQASKIGGGPRHALATAMGIMKTTDITGILKATLTNSERAELSRLAMETADILLELSSQLDQAQRVSE